MTGRPPISVLAFINAVRAELRRPALPALPYVGTDDVLAAALGVEVDGAENLHWELAGRWVMHFAEPWIAEQVATSLGLESVAEPPEVALPDALVDVAVSEQFDVVVEDDEGWVRGWWVPDAEGIPEFITPSDAIVELRSGRSESEE